jgi:hypothetical protein
MQAKITATYGYKCAPDGHTVLNFANGQIVSGKVAEMAVEDGAAVAIEVGPIDTKITPPAETKSRRMKSSTSSKDKI